MLALMQQFMADAQVGKVLGERWKSATSEDKAPFEEMARQVCMGNCGLKCVERFLLGDIW